MLAELAIEIRDLLDRLADAAPCGDAGALGGDSGASRPPAEPDRACELFEQRLVLVAQLLGADDIAAHERGLDVLDEPGGALLVGRARLVIEELARVSGIGLALRAARTSTQRCPEAARWTHSSTIVPIRTPVRM